MPLELGFSEAASRDLDEISDWIETRADAATAVRYVDRIVSACGALVVCPDRGSPREMLQPGLRSIPFERSATIFYRADASQVRIVRVLRAGRSWAAEFVSTR